MKMLAHCNTTGKKLQLENQQCKKLLENSSIIPSSSSAPHGCSSPPAHGCDSPLARGCSNPVPHQFCKTVICWENRITQRKTILFWERGGWGEGGEGEGERGREGKEEGEGEGEWEGGRELGKRKSKHYRSYYSPGTESNCGLSVYVNMCFNIWMWFLCFNLTYFFLVLFFFPTLIFFYFILFHFTLNACLVSNERQWKRMILTGKGSGEDLKRGGERKLWSEYIVWRNSLLNGNF